MTVKTVLLFLFLLAGIFGFFILASWILSLAIASLDANAPYLSAPIIADENGFSGNDGKIVWMYGTISGQSDESILQSPVSQTACIYYYYGKRQGIGRQTVTATATRHGPL